jgi:long-chain fatty acid transport protein
VTYRSTALLLGAALLTASTSASAAGLYFSDRGVRPLGRGGAFVAGADDLGAIYYNPAGIADAGSQLLFDMSWLRFTSSYTRKAILTSRDPNTGAPGSRYPYTFDKVEGTSPILPIPTLAGSYAIRPGLVIAAGMYAPYATITTYPETVKNKPAPQRYSLLSLDGSALAVLGAWIAYRPSPQFSIGAGPTVLLGTFQSTVMFGACVPDRFICSPEQPDYDAKGQLSVGTIVAPSGTIGAIVTPHEKLNLGLSFQLPYFIDSPAQLKTRLPSAAVFENASMEGSDANVKFNLPWILRAGVEVRPLPETRIELAFVFEKWSMHDKITVEPKNTVLRNVALFPPEYHVGSLSIDRSFQDAWSIRLGGEHTFPVGSYKLDARAGLAYEKSAVPTSHLSVLTVDMDKVTVSIGGGLHIKKRWRFDGLIAMVFPFSKDVSPDEAKLYKVNPVRANRYPGDEPPVNAGRYEARALILGLGLRYLFSDPDEPAPVAAARPVDEEEGDTSKPKRKRPDPDADE